MRVQSDGAGSVRVGEADAQLLHLVASSARGGLEIALGSRRRMSVRHEVGAPVVVVVDGTPGDHAAPGDAISLVDPELVPFALLQVEATGDDGQGRTSLTGTLVPAADRTAGTFPELDLLGQEGELVGVDVVVVTDRLPLEHDLLAVAQLVPAGGTAVLLGLVGEGRPTAREVMVRGLLAAARTLGASGATTTARLLVAPSASGSPAEQAEHAAALAALVSRTAPGRAFVLVPGDGDAAPVDLPAAGPAPTSPSWAEVLALLDGGGDLPEGVAPPEVAVELVRSRPSGQDRGVVLLFTGLSGSGKSTIAAGVVSALREEGSRTVTVLDGDRVRTLLSSGLSFSKEDRELNVRRIGYVAAEVARHGGTAVCAPIAPYAGTRAEVRRMVEEVGGTFLLVHVATPLEVCESRDRKGLYARARAGQLPAFTGVSDPYDEPDDAEVVVDTSAQEVDECVEEVLAALGRRGLVAGRTTASP